jgi:hypothetical protein
MYPYKGRTHKMNKYLIPFFLFIFLIFPGYVFAQQDQAVIKSLEQIVAKFRSFFKIKQKLVDKQMFSASPTGFVAVIIEYECTGISYDVEKTQSIITPYTGYILLKLLRRENDSCGNVKDGTRVFGWDTVEGALKQKDNENCFKMFLDGQKATNPVRLNFHHEKGKWLFKEAIHTERKNPARAISTALGVAVNPNLIVLEPEGMKINNRWLGLVK